MAYILISHRKKGNSVVTSPLTVHVEDVLPLDENAFAERTFDIL